MPVTLASLPADARNDGWGLLLRRWGNLLDRYQQYSNDVSDVAYWYGERALTGLLGAAAWQIPHSGCLEEFLGFRGRGKNRAAGRGDAWIVLRGTWYCVEAKQAFVSSIWRDAVSAANKQLAMATAQLRNLDQRFKTEKGMAVCYIIPDFVRRDARITDKRVTELIRKAAQDFTAQRAQRYIVAVYKPLGEQAGEYESGRVPRCCPGAILVARRAW